MKTPFCKSVLVVALSTLGFSFGAVAQTGAATPTKA